MAIVSTLAGNGLNGNLLSVSCHPQNEWPINFHEQETELLWQFNFAWTPKRQEGKWRSFDLCKSNDDVKH